MVCLGIKQKLVYNISTDPTFYSVLLWVEGDMRKYKKGPAS